MIWKFEYLLTPLPCSLPLIQLCLFCYIFVVGVCHCTLKKIYTEWSPAILPSCSNFNTPRAFPSLYVCTYACMFVRMLYAYMYLRGLLEFAYSSKPCCLPVCSLGWLVLPAILFHCTRLQRCYAFFKPIRQKQIKSIIVWYSNEASPNPRMTTNLFEFIFLNILNVCFSFFNFLSNSSLPHSTLSSFHWCYFLSFGVYLRKKITYFWWKKGDFFLLARR